MILIVSAREAALQHVYAVLSVDLSSRDREEIDSLLMPLVLRRNPRNRKPNPHSGRG